MSVLGLMTLIYVKSDQMWGRFVFRKKANEQQVGTELWINILRTLNFMLNTITVEVVTKFHIENAPEL